MIPGLDSVLVLPRRCTGLQGDPDKFGMPPVHRLVSLKEALETKYDNDAHVAMYRVPGCDTMPRLNKSAYPYLVDAGQSVVIGFVMVDLDNPNHAPWASTEEIERLYNRVKSTVIGSNAGFYATRRGARLFWKLRRDLDARYFGSFIRQFISRLAEEGIEADPNCVDWTRLMRLPFATPEGDTVPLSLPYDFDHGTLEWWPDDFEETAPQRRLPNIGTEWPHEPPPVVPPTPGDIDSLNGHTDLQKRIKKGRPIAEPGDRYKATMRAVGIVAQRLADPQPQAIYRVLAYSVAMACSEGPGERSRSQALMDLWRACKNIAGLRLSEVAENEQFRARILEIARDNAEWGGAGEASEEGKQSAPKPPPVEKIDLNGLREVVLFTQSDAYYVLNEKQSFKNNKLTYEGPFRGTSMPAMLEKYAPKVAPPIRNDKGALLGVNEILSRCGAEVKQVHAHIGKTGTHYDKDTCFLIEGVAAIRSDLTPLYNAEIHAWLTLVGGAVVEKFLDWLATFPRINHPTCGLYLRSAGGTGKGMLAEGLARLWGTAPTMYANIIGTHNDGLAVCPLVWADEEIPASHYGKTPSAVFRAFVGNSIFNLRRMYQPAATLHGCLRLLVTANNDNALKIHEDLSEEDYYAIVDRIGYIAVPNEAGEYLRQIGGRAKTVEWVQGDGIARHVLWLMANRPVKHGSRFLVHGWESSMHRHLKNTSGMAATVTEVIAFAVSQKAGPFPLPGFVLGDGVVYATASGVFDAWTKALGANSKVAPKQRIVSALRQLSTSPEATRITIDDGGMGAEQVSVWPVRAQEILDAIEAFQLGDPEPVRLSIERPLKR